MFVWQIFGCFWVDYYKKILFEKRTCEKDVILVTFGFLAASSYRLMFLASFVKF